MKKFEFFVFLLLTLMLGVNFTSCKDDDDEPASGGETPEMPGEDPETPGSEENVDIDIFSNLEKDEMVFVKGGTFLMGAQNEDSSLPNYDSDAYGDESPIHQVTLDSYYMGKYEVTQKLWEYVMGSNPSSFIGESLPVECVSWVDCQEFISKLNQITGKTFRLPTEAEWEYAARGGNKSQGYKYSGSNTIDDVAWYGNNASLVGPSSSNYGNNQVGTKSPNELGIYDMSGNVWELCSDWYDRRYYSSSPSTNPTGPTSGTYRVCRGGGWCYNVQHCRVSFRGSTSDHRNSAQGFRLVCASL